MLPENFFLGFNFIFLNDFFFALSQSFLISVIMA